MRLLVALSASVLPSVPKTDIVRWTYFHLSRVLTCYNRRQRVDSVVYMPPFWVSLRERLEASGGRMR